MLAGRAVAVAVEFVPAGKARVAAAATLLSDAVPAELAGQKQRCIVSGVMRKALIAAWKDVGCVLEMRTLAMRAGLNGDVH